MRSKKFAWRMTALSVSLALVAAVAECGVVKTVHVRGDSKHDHKYWYAEGAYRVVKVVPARNKGKYLPLPGNISEAIDACGAFENACEARIVGESHNGALDVLVASCKSPQILDECRYRVTPLVDRKEEVTLCVPPLRDWYLNPRFEAYLEEYLAYYRQRHDVRHAYLYFLGAPPGWVSKLEHNVTLVRYSASSLWYHGQNWVIQDCTHRATSEGYDYAFNVDLDEWLTFRDPSIKILEYMRNLTKLGYDGADFGSVDESPGRSCGDLGNKTCDIDHVPMPSAVSCNGGVCFREKKMNHDRRLCPKYCGRRKHVVYGPRTLQSNIHFAYGCHDGPCFTYAESTDVAWLRHLDMSEESNTPTVHCPTCIFPATSAEASTGTSRVGSGI